MARVVDDPYSQTKSANPAQRSCRTGPPVYLKAGNMSILCRVRRSYSLKAKTSEDVGIFVLALKRKKMFFSLCSQSSETLQKAKKMKAKMSQKRKEKRKVTIPVKV